MKYNAEFIAAVRTVEINLGDTIAKKVFDKLFDVPEAVEATPVRDLRLELETKVGQYVYASDVAATNSIVGKPGTHSNVVYWIKEFRNRSGFGLKESKDTHDFLRDNPTTFE